MYMNKSLCTRHVPQVYTRHDVVRSPVWPWPLPDIRDVTSRDGGKSDLLDALLLLVLHVLSHLQVLLAHLRTGNGGKYGFSQSDEAVCDRKVLVENKAGKWLHGSVCSWEQITTVEMCDIWWIDAGAVLKWLLTPRKVSDFRISSNLWSFVVGDGMLRGYTVNQEVPVSMVWRDIEVIQEWEQTKCLGHLGCSGGGDHR